MSDILRNDKLTQQIRTKNIVPLLVFETSRGEKHTDFWMYPQMQAEIVFFRDLVNTPPNEFPLILNDG
jgi:hypothetical protein